MNSFRIDPKDLGVEYEVIRGLEYSNIEKSIWKTLENQHDKPTKEAWEASYNHLFTEGKKEPLWLTDNNKTIYRWNYNFIRTNDTQLERKYAAAIRERIMDKFYGSHFRGPISMMEFGCGSGHNLAHFKRTHPNFDCMGSDFSPSAVAITESHGISAQYFDMKTCDDRLLLPRRNRWAFTFGAMEQLGEDYHNFTDYITENFMSGIHIEPIKELYNPYDIFDKLALTYHEKRNYLGEFLTYLKTKHISSVQVVRSSFGNMFNEGYMVVVWQR